jgi:hypothetical protein
MNIYILLVYIIFLFDLVFAFACQTILSDAFVLFAWSVFLLAHIWNDILT